MSLSLDSVTQVVMDGLVYYPFHFVETRSEHARKNWKVLRVVRREGDFFTIPTVFALEGSIEKKLFEYGMRTPFVPIWDKINKE